MEPGTVEGIHLFNTREFFEAHEALEAVWLKTKGDRKTFLHGLIQVAAAFHHHTHGNRAGFRSLLEKGCTKLEKIGGRDRGCWPCGLNTGTSAVAGTPRPILTARSPDATAATNQIDHKTIEWLTGRFCAGLSALGYWVSQVLLMAGVC
jgi:hypothetical protein